MEQFGASRLVIWSFWGFLECASHEISRGGTKLTNKLYVPPPALVVLSSNDEYDEHGEPRPDCVGVFIGGFNEARDQKIALTSFYNCHIYPAAEVRTAKSEVITANQIYYGSSAFQISVLQLHLRRGDWVPTKANVERDRDQVQKYIQRGNNDSSVYGFGLAVYTNPMMAYTLTWNQTDCAKKYDNLRETSWPHELPESTFCVYPGRSPANIVLNDKSFTIAPGTPCDDAHGSPVVYSPTPNLALGKVLGIIIWTTCGKPDIPDVAFAISPAYINEDAIPRTSSIIEPPTTKETTTTEPPPPLPRIPETSRPCTAKDDSSRLSSHLEWLALALCCSRRGNWRL